MISDTRVKAQFTFIVLALLRKEAIHKGSPELDSAVFPWHFFALSVERQKFSCPWIEPFGAVPKGDSGIAGAFIFVSEDGMHRTDCRIRGTFSS